MPAIAGQQARCARVGIDLDQLRSGVGHMEIVAQEHASRATGIKSRHRRRPSEHDLSVRRQRNDGLRCPNDRRHAVQMTPRHKHRHGREQMRTFLQNQRIYAARLGVRFEHVFQFINVKTDAEAVAVKRFDPAPLRLRTRCALRFTNGAQVPGFSHGFSLK